MAVDLRRGRRAHVNDGFPCNIPSRSKSRNKSDKGDNAENTPSVFLRGVGSADGALSYN